MRKFIAPALIALLVAAPGAAFAATTTAPKPVIAASAAQSDTGVIKAINMGTHSLTLADGKQYQLPATFKDPGLKVGSKVTVQWKMNGKAYQATSVSLS